MVQEGGKVIINLNVLDSSCSAEGLYCHYQHNAVWPYQCGGNSNILLSNSAKNTAFWDIRTTSFLNIREGMNVQVQHSLSCMYSLLEQQEHIRFQV